MNTLGKHILIELYNCTPELLDQVNRVEEIMVGTALHIKAQIVHVAFHHFSPFGVSGVVVIEESHLAIHTWPEYGYAAIDLFTCGARIDPWQAYDFLKNNFNSQNGSAMEMRRGQSSLLEETGYKPKAITEQREGYTRQVWFTQREQGMAFSIKQDSIPLFYQKTAFQEVSIFESAAYGKVLSLDNRLVITEGDEYAFHEMLVHPPVLNCPNPERVLVLGGGDGGSVRELLRHPEVAEIWVVEQDKVVTEAVRAHFPDLARALSDPRVRLLTADALHFLETHQHKTFDVVLIDAELASEKTYPLLQPLLHPDHGVLCDQGKSPQQHATHFKARYSALQKHFGRAPRPYLAHIPTYPSGMWSFLLMENGKASDPAPRRQKLLKMNQLQYFTATIHEAAFALPAFVKNLILEV